MVCSKSTMLKTALILGGIAIAGSIALPDFRGWIATALPWLLVLLCTLSMLLCMRHSGGEQKQRSGDGQQ